MKDVPYFPCYAANIIASKEYRLMSLLERGLWISMYLECWPNKLVPSDTRELAKYLGFDEGEVSKAKTKNLMTLFLLKDADIVHPELELYREEILQRRLKQSKGGKDGANKRYGKGEPIGQPIGSLGYINSDQVNSDQVKSNQYLEKGVINNLSKENKEWINDYENTEIQ